MKLKMWRFFEKSIKIKGVDFINSTSKSTEHEEKDIDELLNKVQEEFQLAYEQIKVALEQHLTPQGIRIHIEFKE